ncbi:MAG: hydrogenase maturation peptidase HycI [Candidatus Thermoplasmatota archaeon]|nr:hydrogenase maturation peptidase HycI [Candidatus Thermoplasmatota archaeon]
MCVGNRDGGDDAIGPYIADKLKKTKHDFAVLDCGTVPENFTADVKKYNPNYVIIIDAVEMNLKPGEIRIMRGDKISEMHISTHGIPLSILMKYLKQYVNQVILIGIQPVKMTGNITRPVKNAANELIEIIKNGKTDIIQIL